MSFAPLNPRTNVILESLCTLRYLIRPSFILAYLFYPSPNISSSILLFFNPFNLVLSDERAHLGFGRICVALRHVLTYVMCCFNLGRKTWHSLVGNVKNMHPHLLRLNYFCAQCITKLLHTTITTSRLHSFHNTIKIHIRKCTKLPMLETPMRV